MPSRSMEPESGSCSVATVRMSELLPAPLGPRSPNIRLPIVSERFFNAFTPFGYVLDRPVMVSAKGSDLLEFFDDTATWDRRSPFVVCFEWAFRPRNFVKK